MSGARAIGEGYVANPLSILLLLLLVVLLLFLGSIDFHASLGIRLVSVKAGDNLFL
jgi:hypothetical protein